MLNIWILEKTGAKEYPGAALQLIKFIQDERCRMDASRAADTLLVSSGKGATKRGSTDCAYQNYGEIHYL